MMGWYVNGKLWIPLSLAPKVLVHNHVRLGHGAKSWELKALEEYYFELTQEKMNQRLSEKATERDSPRNQTKQILHTNY